MQKYEVPPPGDQIGMAPPPPDYQVGTAPPPPGYQVGTAPPPPGYQVGIAPPPPGYMPQLGFVQPVQAAPAQQMPQGYVTVQAGPELAPGYLMGMHPSLGVNTSWPPPPQIVVASALPQPQVVVADAPHPSTNILHMYTVHVF